MRKSVHNEIRALGTGVAAVNTRHMIDAKDLGLGTRLNSLPGRTWLTFAN